MSSSPTLSALRLKGPNPGFFLKERERVGCVASCEKKRERERRGHSIYREEETGRGGHELARQNFESLIEGIHRNESCTLKRIQRFSHGFGFFQRCEGERERYFPALLSGDAVNIQFLEGLWVSGCDQHEGFLLVFHCNKREERLGSKWALDADAQKKSGKLNQFSCAGCSPARRCNSVE